MGWGRFPLARFSLHFSPPRRKRHLRISKKILEDIKVVSIQMNSFLILRRCCKFVLPSLGGVGGGSHQTCFSLHFSPPRRKRHLRISQKILEDIKAVSMQTNSFYSIFSNILRYTAKRLGVFLLAVQSSSSQVTSKNIVENLRRYQGRQHTNEFISYLKKMLQPRAPLLGRGWGRSPLARFSLHFSPPCRKRHLRISQKILEDIKAVTALHPKRQNIC